MDTMKKKVKTGANEELDSLVVLYQKTGHPFLFNVIKFKLNAWVLARTRKIKHCDRDDVIQAIWVLIWNKVIPSYRYQLSKFINYTWASVKHLLQKKGSEKKELQIQPTDEINIVAPPEISALCYDELAPDVAKLEQFLKPISFAVVDCAVYLYCKEGFDNQNEIIEKTAFELGLSPGTVKKILSKKTVEKRVCQELFD